MHDKVASTFTFYQIIVTNIYKPKLLKNKYQEGILPLYQLDLLNGFQCFLCFFYEYVVFCDSMDQVVFILFYLFLPSWIPFWWRVNSAYIQLSLSQLGLSQLGSMYMYL